MDSLTDHRIQGFSQNGEEGIIARVFEMVGAGNKFCCEFGAWDGIHLSNTRTLILDGWSALLIEADADRFCELRKTYSNGRVVCVNEAVDTAQNSLATILGRVGLPDRRLDLLSIDIDGPDYEIFATLNQLRALPRLVVVEVQPEHGPDRADLLPAAIARHNNGQPLAAFIAKGGELGYRLICYFGGNAFFLANDVGADTDLPTVSATEAWNGWYAAITPPERDYLFQRNIGLHGGYCFDNPKLSADALGILRSQAKRLHRRRFAQRIRATLRSILRSSD